MKKRLLSLLLALVMIVGMLPATTLAVSAAENSIESFDVQIEKPLPGNHPSTEYTILGDANYTVTRVAWYDADEVELSQGDIFAEDGIYTVEVTFACNDGYVLPEDIGRAAKINGMDAHLSGWNEYLQTVTYYVKFFPEQTVVTSDLKTMRDALQKDNESTTVIINDDINVVMDYTYYGNGKSFVNLNLSNADIQKNLIINGDINITADSSLLMKAFIQNYGSGTLRVKGNGSLTVTFDENDPSEVGADSLSRWQYKNILMQLNYKHNRLIVEESVMLKTTNGHCIAISTGGYDIKGGIFDGLVSLREHVYKSSISGGVFKENLYYYPSDDGAPEMLISGGTFEKGCTNIHAENIAPNCTAFNKDGSEFVFPNGNSFDDYVYFISPKFTTQPQGGTVVYNQRHIANWATNFTPVKQELVRYSSAGSVVQTQALSAGAFQAGLSYMTDGYYYRIRAYYDSTSYIESDKFYVTPDQYFTPNNQHGNEEGDIITGITYVPNGDGTFNANVHVDLNCVDGQMLQYYWASTGYYWYDHNNKVNYGIGTTDTSKLVFTLYNLGENLVPGKEWKVKVYLADDPYADYEWRDVDFHYVTDTVPELKPEDVVTPPDVYVVGDINKDGTVNVIDVVLLKRSIASKEESSLDIEVADINGNGVINAIDVIQLKRNITGGYN